LLAVELDAVDLADFDPAAADLFAVEDETFDFTIFCPVVAN